MYIQLLKKNNSRETTNSSQDEKKCSDLSHKEITGRNCVMLIVTVYDVILPIVHVSLTLDGVNVVFAHNKRKQYMSVNV